MHRDDRRTHSDHPLDERVAALLAAAAAPTESGPVPGEEQVLAAFRASHETARRSFMRSPLTPAKTALAAAVGATVLLTGGVAAAATGSLPGAAQEKASEMLTKVGVSVPGPDEHSAGHPDVRGGSASDDDETQDPEVVKPAEDSGKAAERSGDSHGKGEAVSEMATSDETTGVEKGAAVSGYASGGKSQAGVDHQQGKPAEETEEPAEETGAADEPATDDSAVTRRVDGDEEAAERRTDGAAKGGQARERATSDD